MQFMSTKTEEEKNERIWMVGNPKNADALLATGYIQTKADILAFRILQLRTLLNNPMKIFSSKNS